MEPSRHPGSLPLGRLPETSQSPRRPSADTTQERHGIGQHQYQSRVFRLCPVNSTAPMWLMQSPASGMHFTAPATIRIYADPFDGDAADPDALTVNFLVNGQSAGTFTGSGAQNGYFALTVNNLTAGTYAITAQINSVGHGTVTSAPVTVFVDNPPASSGPVFNLTADVVLSGSQNATYAGTASQSLRHQWKRIPDSFGGGLHWLAEYQQLRYPRSGHGNEARNRRDRQRLGLHSVDRQRFRYVRNRFDRGERPGAGRRSATTNSGRILWCLWALNRRTSPP